MYYWGIHVGSLADRQGCGRNDKLMRMFGMCVNFNYSKPSGLSEQVYPSIPVVGHRISY